jgi:hypothetical protein
MPPGRDGKITLAEIPHDWERQAVLLLNYNLAFAFKLRKSTTNLSEGNRVVGDYSLRQLGCLFRDSIGWPVSISTPRLLVGDFSQPSVGTGVFQVAEKGIPRIS